jgi:hypothetical protein
LAMSSATSSPPVSHVKAMDLCSAGTVGQAAGAVKKEAG